MLCTCVLTLYVTHAGVYVTKVRLGLFLYMLVSVYGYTYIHIKTGPIIVADASGLPDKDTIYNGGPKRTLKRETVSIFLITLMVKCRSLSLK